MTHKERMLAILYDKKVPDKVPHGDVTVDPKIAQAVFKSLIAEEKGNFLVYWMTESFSDRFFERHRRLREFLAFDFAHVFPREPLAQIGETREGYPIIKDVWGGASHRGAPFDGRSGKPDTRHHESRRVRFPDVSDFSFDNLERWVQGERPFHGVPLDTGFFKVYLLVGFTTYHALDREQFRRDQAHHGAAGGPADPHCAGSGPQGGRLHLACQRFRVQPGTVHQPEDPVGPRFSI